MIPSFFFRLVAWQKRINISQFSQIKPLKKIQQRLFQPISFNPITNNRDSFRNVLNDLKSGKQQQFNFNLTKYLKETSINTDQLFQLLQLLHQTNIYCHIANKDLLLTAIKNQTNVFNEQMIAIWQFSFQVGIGDQQMSDQFIDYFAHCNIDTLTTSKRFDIIFVVASVLKKYQVKYEAEGFQKQWKLMLSKISQDLQLAETIYVKKYPHLAFILKIALTEERLHDLIFNDLKELFSKMTKKFISENCVEKLELKEVSILLSSIIKIKEQFLVQEMTVILEQLIILLKKTDLEYFNNQSLTSITLSLSKLPSNQEQMLEPLIATLSARILEGKINYKFYLLILYEIYFKWQIQVPQNHLTKVIATMTIREYQDYDLAHYFQLLTLIPAENLDSIFSKIKLDIMERKQPQSESKILTDKVSITRITKSFEKMKKKLKESNIVSEHFTVIQKFIFENIQINK